jgi:hypothetical protein
VARVDRSEAFRSIERSIAAKGEAAGIFEHHGTIGTAREILTEEGLKPHLPGRTKIAYGEVDDSRGRRSASCDLIIYDTKYGTFSVGSRQLVPAAAAILIVEVKSMLTSAELIKSLQAITKLKELERQVGGGSWNYPFGDRRIEVPPVHVFAAIIAFKAVSWDTLSSCITSSGALYNSDYMRFGPDVIGVLEEGAAVKHDGVTGWGHDNPDAAAIYDQASSLEVVCNTVDRFVTHFGNMAFA